MHCYCQDDAATAAADATASLGTNNNDYDIKSL